MKIKFLTATFLAKYSGSCFVKQSRNFPYSATPEQIRNRQHGVKYNNHLFREIKNAITHDYEIFGQKSNILQDAIENGCNISF